MRRPPLILWGTSAVTWALTGAAALEGVRTRVWLCSLAASVISTQTAAMATLVSGRVDRAYVAMAKAFFTRPYDDDRLARVIVGALVEATRPGSRSEAERPD